MTGEKQHENGFSCFEKVAPTIWKYVRGASAPSTPEATDAIECPSHVILFTWTGARKEHILKYSEKYIALFPHACLYIVTTSPKDLCFRSSRQKQIRLRPLLDRLMLYEGGSGATILAHVFSEGGSNKAVALAEACRVAFGRRLPVSALCLDSTPGQPRFLPLCNALAKALPPHPLLKHTGLLVGGATLGGMWFLFHILWGYESNPISRTGRLLLDQWLFDSRAPRCYLYSNADAVVLSQDIEQHIQDAIEREIPVRQVLFDGSEHCKHAVHEPELYWKAVLQTWTKTIATSKRRAEEKETML